MRQNRTTTEHSKHRRIAVFGAWTLLVVVVVGVGALAVHGGANPVGLAFASHATIDPIGARAAVQDVIDPIGVNVASHATIDPIGARVAIGIMPDPGGVQHTLRLAHCTVMDPSGVTVHTA